MVPLTNDLILAIWVCLVLLMVGFLKTLQAYQQIQNVDPSSFIPRWSSQSDEIDVPADLNTAFGTATSAPAPPTSHERGAIQDPGTTGSCSDSSLLAQISSTQSATSVSPLPSPILTPGPGAEDLPDLCLLQVGAAFD